MEEKRSKSTDLIYSVLCDLEYATRIEGSIHNAFKNDLKKYCQKIRSIVFNLKSNSEFREKILQNRIDIAILPYFSPAEVDSTLWDPIFKKRERKRKINELIDQIACE